MGRKIGLETTALMSVLLAGGMLVGTAEAASGDGTALAQRVYDRPDGDDLVTDGRMILTEPGQSPRERHMISYTKDNEGGDFWSLIRFLAPAKIRETGLLSDSPAAGADGQWLYLPALKRVRRISSKRMGGRFVSSDLFYEDLQDRKVSEDTHTLKGEEEIGGRKCSILESIPVDPSNSTYSKRLSWIDDVTLLPLRIDFFKDGGTEPVKRFEVNVERIAQVQGYWTIMDSTMTDLESGHRTQTVVDSIKYDQGIPENLFSKSVLEDAVREEQYRPK